jgi:cell division protein FtsB
MKKEVIRQKIEEKKARRSAYLDREAEMLTGGVQSYGIGSRNLTRYQTDLANIREAIKELEKEIDQLEGQLAGQSRRRALGVIPRDW